MRTALFSLLFIAGALGADDQLTRHRNLGKAFYENPTTQLQAVQEFRTAMQLAPGSAMDRLNYGLALLRAGKTDEGIAELIAVQKQDPKLPHTWFNLGIQYKKQGNSAGCIVQFERMIALVPDDPISHYNLGACYKVAGRTTDAVREFETASNLDSRLAGPHFQLYNAYRTAGRTADATRELQTFQKLKKDQEGAVIPEDMEWNNYAEIYDPIEPAPAPQPPPRFLARTLPAKVDASTAGVLPVDAFGDGSTDAIVWSASGATLLRHGATPVAGAIPEGGALAIAAGDFDNDGLSDLAVVTPSGVTLYRNAKGKFLKHGAAVATGEFRLAVWLDYDHDYDLDLILLGKNSKLLRNQGSAGFADRTADIPFVQGEAVAAKVLRFVPDTKGLDLAVRYREGKSVLYRDLLGGRFEVQPFNGTIEVSRSASADFDGDGDLDVLEIAGDGTVQFKESEASGGTWISVRLEGVKNLKLARYAEVEIKAAGVYEKRLYEGVPLWFPLGGRKQVDTVRITWPNGLIQNEPNLAAGSVHSIQEAQRLSGSCPMIWSWNGREFVFVTDVLGVAPLGASAGDGKYFPVDHDEYIQIPRDALVSRDRAYEIRMTEELSEVAYLDRVSLIAVDHPAGVDIVTNDKFKAPPFPEFRLFGITRRVPPVRAVQNGEDVRNNLLSRDRVYADNFRRDRNGVAETWSIDLDFGQAAPDGRGILILNGWVDWADGSTFLAQAQEGRGGLVMPYLQVRDANGKWQTVIEDMGMPAGKPKTIAVDLTGKFLSASREVRIVTNLALHWDEVYLSESVPQPQVRMTELFPAAQLHFRGFSRAVIDPERRQPETFLYGEVSPVSMWNPTPGMYTRYGSVSELLDEADDRFLIMGSGDEVRLSFDAGELPPVPAGHVRDFLLRVDGWAKDRDANTSHSQTVEPLPFRAMSAYPYAAEERFPEDPMHRMYRETYNTRPALRLLRPLDSGMQGGRP